MDASAGGTEGGVDAGPDANEAGPPPYCPLEDYVVRTCDEAGACDAEEGCFRGVCVRTCNLPLQDLDDVLGDAVEPVATICNGRAPLYATHARQDGDCTRVDVFGYRVNGGATPNEVSWQLRGYEVDPFVASPGNIDLRNGTFISPGGNPFFQSGISINPSGTLLVSYLYYNTGTPNPMIVDLAGGAPFVDDALARPSSHYGIDFLDDQRLIVAQNATGDSEFIVYDQATGGSPIPVLVGFGNLAGSVRVLHGAGVVLAGNAVNDLYVVELDRVRDVADGTIASPIDVTTDAEVQHLTGTRYGFFRTIGETRLALGTGNFGDPLEVRKMTFSGTTLSLGAAETLTTNDQAFEGFLPLTGDLVYLPHYQRALIARWANP
jgi:hypothetical protein